MFMNFGEAINTSSLSIFTVNLKARYDVDNTALGTLFAIRKFISVFSPLISGAFIRRFGFAPVLLLSVSMLCCGSLLLLVSVRMRLGFATLSLGFMIASTFFSTAQVAAFTGYSKVFRGGELALAFALDYASFQFGAGLCGFIAPSLVNIVTNDFSSAFALSSIAIFISFLICIFVLFRAPLYLDRTHFVE
jgi:MFS family permease